jgi:hypothetical protein
MAKRHKRVKLSKAQKLENERNRWLFKKDQAIHTLVKAMEKLKELDRSVRRMERLPIKPPPLDLVDDRDPVTRERESFAAAPTNSGEAPAPKPKRQRKPKAAALPSLTEDQAARDARMVSMGFRKTKK